MPDVKSEIQIAFGDMYYITPSETQEVVDADFERLCKEWEDYKIAVASGKPVTNLIGYVYRSYAMVDGELVPTKKDAFSWDRVCLMAQRPCTDDDDSTDEIGVVDLYDNKVIESDNSDSD